MTVIVSQLIEGASLQDILVDKLGQPLSAGVVTFYGPDGVTLKNWYYQSGNTPGPYIYLAGPNPLTLSAAGTIVDVSGNDVLPLYYPYSQTDNSVAEPYFVTVYDQFGTFQFSRENFPFLGNIQPSSAVETLQQYVINNRFWRNIGTLDAGTLTNSWTTQYNNTGTVYYATLAPSQHDGFSMPDFNYIKDSNGAAETITFTKFPLQSAQTLEGDITPEWYIHHSCTGFQIGQELKVYQFPVSLHVNTLADVEYTFTIQARWVSGDKTLSIYVYQFLGTGVMSSAPAQKYTVELDSQWQKYDFTTTFPTTNGLTLGQGGDDAIYIQIGMPVTENFVIDFTLPTIYLGTQAATNSFATYDEIDTVINSPRTGDIRTSLNNFYYFGWAPMNDGVLVNDGIVVSPSVGTAFQGVEGWPLYDLLWAAFQPYDSGSNSNLIAQMYTNGGVATNYGTSAIADWAALKQLSLTRMMGRVILGDAPQSILRSPYKSTFTASQITTTFTASSSNGLLITTTQAMSFGEQVQFSTSGGTLPTGLAAATTYYAVPITSTTFNVATSLANARTNTLIAYTDAGTPTNSVQSFALVLTTINSMNLFTGMPITFSNTGGAFPTGISAGAVYYAIPSSATTLSVALTFNDAITGNSILYTDAGTPTNTVAVAPAGSYDGEYQHSQLTGEVGSHIHTGTTNTQFLGFAIASGSLSNVVIGSGAPSQTLSLPGTATIAPNSPAGRPFNVIQPNTLMNIFIKL